MTIDRSNADPDSESVMSVHFAPSDAIQTSNSATSSPASIESTTIGSQPSDHTPTERIQTIEMKFRSNSQILDELMRITKAYPIEPTAEEKEEIKFFEEQAVRSEKDRTMMRDVRARIKREKELLDQARGDLATNAA